MERGASAYGSGSWESCRTRRCQMKGGQNGIPVRHQHCRSHGCDSCGWISSGSTLPSRPHECLAAWPHRHWTRSPRSVPAPAPRGPSPNLASLLCQHPATCLRRGEGWRRWVQGGAAPDPSGAAPVGLQTERAVFLGETPS